MKKLAVLLALLVLLGGCGVNEVDIINTEPPQASIPAATPPAEPPSPAPSETPAATPEPLAEDMVNIVDMAYISTRAMRRRIISPGRSYMPQTRCISDTAPRSSLRACRKA